MEALESRLDELEQRVVRIEKELFAPAPAPVTPPRPAPRVQPKVPEPAARPRPERPRSLEIDFGRWLLSRLGGLSLVAAAGFLFHYAASRGLLGPEMRLTLGGLAGAALIGIGEWQSRSLRHFSAALSGAGVAILFVCAYAGHAHYGFYGYAATIAFTTAIAAGGVVQALRHNVEAVAGLAAVGGFAAPIFVLYPQSQPAAVLAYVLVLNLGLCALRARTGWKSPEAVAWLGTAVVTTLPLAQVSLSTALFYLIAYVALFGIRPRLRPGRFAPAYTLVLSAVTTGASFLLYRMHDAPGWPVFIGGLAAVLAVGAVLNVRRDAAVAWSDLTAATGMGMLAILDGFDLGWQVALGWSGLAAALQLLPLRGLERQARYTGMAAAFLAVAHLAHLNTRADTPGLLVAFLAAGGAVAAARTRAALWGGVVLCALGFGVEVATLRGAEPWPTLLLLSPAVQTPSARLLAGGAVGGLIALYALYRRRRTVLVVACAYLGLLGLADMLYGLDGVGVVPLGLVAAVALVALRPRQLWPVSVGLALAVAGDLIPPADYLPFLNRRAVALGAVLAAGWAALRGRRDVLAIGLMAGVLGAAEIASVADRAGGASPWGHLVLLMTSQGAAMPLFNARFLFLIGVAGAFFLVARRWKWCGVPAHVYVMAGLGAEGVGLVEPGLRRAPWTIFQRPEEFMAAQLALTGILLVYGAALVTTGILRGRVGARRTGLGMLVAGAAKVSLFDLAALDDIYRVGSFLALGATLLVGSYAYNRWLSAGEIAAGLNSGLRTSDEGGEAEAPSCPV